MPRKIESPWEKTLRRAQAQGVLDAQEGLYFPKRIPQILDALEIKAKLDLGELSVLKSMYSAGFRLGGEWS